MIEAIAKRLKNQKGFTLVELMVVIVIIGILVAIAVPAYKKVTENAEKKACEANIRSLMGAVQLYRVDTNGQYPSADLSELEEKGLIEGGKLPSCPSDDQYKYTFDKESGTVQCTNPAHQQSSGNNGSGGGASGGTE